MRGTVLRLEPEPPPTDTPLRFPGKILADANSERLFIADTGHNRIVVTTLDGKLLDIIGSGAIGRSDGEFSKATFDHPQGCTLHQETLYVADTENHMIRKVDLKAKTVKTIAGTGKQADPLVIRTRRGLPLKGTTLSLYGVDEIGEHYAETLRRWRANFHGRLEDVHRLGYDRRFERTWDFYLAFCEAAFRTRMLRDAQLLFARPGCGLHPAHRDGKQHHRMTGVHVNNCETRPLSRARVARSA